MPSNTNANWRTIIGARALRKLNNTVHVIQIDHWMSNTALCRQLCADADLIILQRVLIEESIEQAIWWYQRGKTVVVDFDDAYQLIQDDNQAHVFWGLGKVEITGPFGVKYTKYLDQHPVKQFSDALAKISGATMPSKVLAADWKFAGKCYYIPNYIDSDRYLQFKTFARPDSSWITIGYGGSMSHIPSFQLSGVEEALRQVTQQRKNVRVMVCGDKRVFDRMPVRTEQKVHINYCRWNEWPRVLGMFDIGIAPMARRYDDSRSWIKACEYSIMGIPFVASRCAPYQDFIDAGIGRYVTFGEDEEKKLSRADEWTKTLLDMVDHLEDYKKEATSFPERCMEIADVDRNVLTLEKSYQNIIKEH